MIEEFFQVYVGVEECTFQCEAINFVVVRKNNYSAIRMFHLNVAAFTMELFKSQAPQCRKHLLAGRAAAVSYSQFHHFTIFYLVRLRFKV